VIGRVTHDLDALRALYADADRALEGWTCELSTDCCHFERTGREPYLWPNEWALLERAMAARGMAPRRAVPARGEARARNLAVVDRRCPLLGRDGRCTVYAERPFGCRTFFCERGTGPTPRPPRTELTALGRAIAALAQREDPSCDGPLPLSGLLARRK
jgi:Fe-S-cluster containining protein